MDNEQYLFSPDLLEKLSKWQEISASLRDKNLIARPLKLSDYDHGYVEILKQLTIVGKVTKDQFVARFKQMRLINQVDVHYLIVIIENESTKSVVGASTLFLEYKFIHECSIRGRLEDVVIRDTYRGKQIGELVVNIIVELAHQVFNCYKLSLDCTDDLMKFYAKNGFSYGSNMLSVRFHD